MCTKKDGTTNEKSRKSFCSEIDMEKIMKYFCSGREQQPDCWKFQSENCYCRDKDFLDLMKDCRQMNPSFCHDFMKAKDQ